MKLRNYRLLHENGSSILGFEPTSAPAPSVPAWQGRSIGTTKLRLVEFSAFLEQQRDPESVSVVRVSADLQLFSAAPHPLRMLSRAKPDGILYQHFLVEVTYLNVQSFSLP